MNISELKIEYLELRPQLSLTVGWRKLRTERGRQQLTEIIQLKHRKGKK